MIRYLAQLLEWLQKPNKTILYLDRNNKYIVQRGYVRSFYQCKEDALTIFTLLRWKV